MPIIVEIKDYMSSQVGEWHIFGCHSATQKYNRKLIQKGFCFKE